MARQGRLVTGERERRLDVLVAALDRRELTTAKAMELLGFDRRETAWRWIRDARAELRRRRAPVTPADLSLAGSTAGARIMAKGLKNGAQHADAA